MTADRPPVSGEPSTEALRESARRRLRNDLTDIRDTSTDGWARTKADTLLRVVLDAALAEARATPPSLDVERLRQAIDNFITSQTGFDVDDAEAIAAEYARLTSKEERPAPLDTDDSDTRQYQAGEPPA